MLLLTWHSLKSKLWKLVSLDEHNKRTNVSQNFDVAVGLYFPFESTRWGLPCCLLPTVLCITHQPSVGPARAQTIDLPHNNQLW